MKKSKSILILLLVLVLILCASLVACNKKGQTDAQKERARQVERAEQTFLVGLNSKWNANLTDEEIAKLDTAGDYVVTKGWTSLVCEVLKDSSLQTAKIQTFADTLESEDGKKLLEEFSQNAELLVPLLKRIGLTSGDVSSLAYDLVSKLIQSGSKTVSQIVDRLDGVKDVMIQNGASAAAVQNVSENRVVLNLAKQSLNATDAQKKEMQSALDNAKNAFGELIAFAYDTSVNTLTDELYSKIFAEDGALSNVSESELSTLVSALLGNVSKLKNALSQSEVEKLDAALNLFIENFDDKNISSQVYAQIMIYAKYAYMVADVIPSLCEVAEASRNVISSKAFIEDFLSCVKLENDETLDDTTNTFNKLVLSARVIDGIMAEGRFDQNAINSLIDRVCEQGKDGYQKAMPVIVLDLLLNVSDLVGNDESAEESFSPTHPDVIDNDTLSLMIVSLLFASNVEKMKQAYYDFEINPTQANLQALYTKALLCNIEGILDESYPYARPSSPDESNIPYIKQWYQWNVARIDAVSQKITSCVDSVKADLKLFVSDFFAENSESREAMKQIAGWQIQKENIAEGVMDAEYMPVLLKSRILGAALLFVF